MIWGSIWMLDPSITLTYVRALKRKGKYNRLVKQEKSDVSWIKYLEENDNRSLSNARFVSTSIIYLRTRLVSVLWTKTSCTGVVISRSLITLTWRFQETGEVVEAAVVSADGRAGSRNYSHRCCRNLTERTRRNRSIVLIQGERKIRLRSEIMILELVRDFFFSVATLHVLWDLSSWTRNWTHASCSGCAVLTTGPPGKRIECTFIHGRKWERRRRSWWYK